jgi:pimeloyl-ACP methyl ester carboxylesterase
MQTAPDRESEGFFAGLAQKYDSIWQTFILPDRMSYLTESLGPEFRRLDRDAVYQRQDFKCTNVRGEKLECSFFKHQSSEHSKAMEADTCLLYLHSHGGNRLEGLTLLRQAASLKMNLCCFDFAGSGHSEGKYTTLGLRESEDCRVVVETLMRTLGQRKFVLWGRSMGAVAAILYAAGKQPHIKSLVLDSPFSDVEQMVRDAGNSYISLGEYLALFLFSMVKNDIKKHIGQDLSTFQPIKFCQLCEAPCVFIVGKSDPLVPPERVQQMLEAYKGQPKDLMVIEGSHSSGRSLADVEKVFGKVAAHLKIEMKEGQPMGKDSFHSDVVFGHAMVDKFGEIDSILSQKRLEKKINARELQPRSANEFNKPVPNDKEEDHHAPRVSKLPTRISRQFEASSSRQMHDTPFNVAPPRYVNYLKPGHLGMAASPQMRHPSNIESVTNSFYKSDASSPFKVSNYSQPKEVMLNKENLHHVNSSGLSKTQAANEPRKSTSFVGFPQNQASSNYSKGKQVAQSDRSSSKNLLFSNHVQGRGSQLGGFQNQVLSPVVQTDSSIRGLTQISPFQVSPSTQKATGPPIATRLSRPSSPFATDNPVYYPQRPGNASLQSNHFRIPQEGNLLEQHLQSGQLKAALQSRLKEKQTAGHHFSTFASSHQKVSEMAKMHRTDSFHQLFGMHNPQVSSTSTTMVDPFNRVRKSIRQVKIFDDLDDSPQKDASISLFNHTVSIYPGTDRGQPAAKLTPLAFAHHTTSFR